jgi:DNA-3-methyladenine glycosylase I
MDATLLAPDPVMEPSQRCFGGKRPLYQAYHDWEWGEPVHGDTALFERLSLEILAGGLSWFAVLQKRQDLREAFAGFDPAVVAAFGDDDIDRLMSSPKVIRNLFKIKAIIGNARALVAFQAAGGSLDDLVWSHAPASHAVPLTRDDVPNETRESRALAEALKSLGFRWMGPVIAYSTMEACGVVNDHLKHCPRALKTTKTNKKAKPKAA